MRCVTFVIVATVAAGLQFAHPREAQDGCADVHRAYESEQASRPVSVIQKPCNRTVSLLGLATGGEGLMKELPAGSQGLVGSQGLAADSQTHGRATGAGHIKVFDGDHAHVTSLGQNVVLDVTNGRATSSGHIKRFDGAQGVLLSTRSEGHCESVAGYYKDDNSYVVHVEQDGCSLKASLTAGAVAESARIAGASILVSDGTEVGRRTDHGDISFANGELWRRLESDDSNETQRCLATSQLLFLHVMKNGGTSIDSFLACQCKKIGCKVHLSLGPLDFFEGDKTCGRPAVCSTHGAYRDREQLCGQEFKDVQRTFTVFRDPVERAFSLYNYQKSQGVDVAPIAKLYEKCDAAEETGTEAPWLCYGMVNHMVYTTFAPTSMNFSSRMNVSALSQAKEAVAALNATFFMDDFARFPGAFAHSRLLPKSLDDGQCELTHHNPTECASCTDSPTAEEVELIRSHNEMDILLYEYGRSLGNRYGAGD